MSAVYCLTFLIGSFVFTVSAVNIPLSVANVNGLMVTMSPDQGSLGVDRQLPNSNPAPSPTAPPPTTTPASQSASGSSSSVPPNNPIPTPTTTGAPKFAGRIDATLVSVRELTSNMSEVQKFNQFTNFSPISPARVEDVAVVSSNPSAMANCQLVMNTPLYPTLNTTQFGVMACSMRTNTTVTLGNEVNQIFAGQLGISLQMYSWPWTSSGAYIELNLTITVPAGRKPSIVSRSSVAATKIGLGNSDAYALLSARSCDDNTTVVYTAMPSNYPMVILGSGATSNVATVVLMFPRTTSSAIIWNSVFEPGYGAALGSVSAAESVISTARLMMIHAVTVILAVLLAGRV